MGHLSAHVLDTVHGRPAKGVCIELFALAADGRHEVIRSTITNADGRTDEPLLSGDAFQGGAYELVFHVGDYFRSVEPKAALPPFLDLIPVRFTVAEPNERYHVPLLVSPWSYSTYRGS